MIFFPGMSHDDEEMRKANQASYLDQAFCLGAELGK